MDRDAFRADLLLLLTAAIWGFAFVAQRVGMDHVGPFTYNGIRFAIGSLSLLPLIILTERKEPAASFSLPARHCNKPDWFILRRETPASSPACTWSLCPCWGCSGNRTPAPEPGLVPSWRPSACIFSA